MDIKHILKGKFTGFIFLVIILLIFTFSFFNYRNANQAKASSQKFFMDTFVDQVLYGENSQNAVDEANDYIVYFEEKYSMFKENSLVSHINKNAGIEKTFLSDEEYDFFKRSVYYCKVTFGVFDISISPLTILWNINSKTTKKPSEQDIKNNLQYVDYNKIILNDDEKSIFLSEKNMKIDLGAIAKGEVITHIKNIYDKNKISSGYLSIGGNILAYKKDENAKNHLIGIRDPFSEVPSKTVLDFYTQDKIISTSGGYERFFLEDGVKYHHIIDPRTGYPSNSDIASVSVVSEDGAFCDFLSTTLFILGSDYINDILEKEEFSVIAVKNDGDILISNNLKDKIKG